ncbi:MAG: type II toxin-antitoxin system HigB family toxin [Candidatus Poribacteria bacterium]|nr:type II toxin-antitoxin system HigB family toxin [Candidatus Poribacteria bacterium]
MKIVYGRKLTEFAQRHPNARSGLEHWFRLMAQGSFRSIVEMRQTFLHADIRKEHSIYSGRRVPYSNRETKYTVFNIGGNKARLTAIVQYEFQRVIIEKVETHAEYDKSNKRR